MKCHPGIGAIYTSDRNLNSREPPSKVKAVKKADRKQYLDWLTESEKRGKQ